MNKPHYRRTLKSYDRTGLTSRNISELLPAVLSRIDKVYLQKPDLILAAWPDVIGPKLSGMTRAISFVDGILVVKVKNSTLNSLLQSEKPKVLSVLRKRFPDALIKTIYFRIG